VLSVQAVDVPPVAFLAVFLLFAMVLMPDKSGIRQRGMGGGGRWRKE
jgi:hypothetical protein